MDDKDNRTLSSTDEWNSWQRRAYTSRIHKSATEHLQKGRGKVTKGRIKAAINQATNKQWKKTVTELYDGNSDYTRWMRMLLDRPIQTYNRTPLYMRLGVNEEAVQQILCFRLRRMDRPGRRVICRGCGKGLTHLHVVIRKAFRIRTIARPHMQEAVRMLNEESRECGGGNHQL